MNADLNIGKGVFVVNGTGAGQYRRVVDFHWSHDETGTIPSWWVLDRPFEVSPDHDAVIAISTFRGEMIFHNNHYEDAVRCQLFENHNIPVCSVCHNDFTTPALNIASCIW